MDANYREDTAEDHNSADSFSVPVDAQAKPAGYEFDSEKLDFGNDLMTKNLAEVDNSFSERSKIGLEDSRELSRINRMYDVLYTETNSVFNLEKYMENEGVPKTQSQIFGLEEDARLGESEKVRIVNTIVTTHGGGKHTEFKIMGIWKEEKFIITRRYKEFYYLRKRLEERWPGFYIPPIPHKVAFGNMNFKVVSERMYILNRFLADLADRKYFWESEEMRIFIKPDTNVTGELRILHKLSIEEILERVKQEAEINIQANEILIEQYHKTNKDFKEKCLENMPFLNKFKTFLQTQCDFVDHYFR